MTDAEGSRQAFQNRSRLTPPVLPSQYPTTITSHVGLPKDNRFHRCIRPRCGGGSFDAVVRSYGDLSHGDQSHDGAHATLHQQWSGAMGIDNNKAGGS